MRSRLALRSWQFRQRRYSKGVWFRLRYLLAFSARAFVIPEEEAATLRAEGYDPEPVGRELEPEKTLIFVPADRAKAIPGAREIDVRISAAFLAAPAVALVRFSLPGGKLGDELEPGSSKTA